jgi:hypothetical protein
MTAKPTLTPVEYEKEQFQALAEHAYDRVLQTANRFMFNCKNFPIEILKLEDPSYAEIAHVLHKSAGLIAFLSDEFDPMMGTKAHDYCQLMTAMAVAIDQGNEIELARLVAEMERKPGC